MSERQGHARRADAVAAVECFSLACIAVPGLTNDADRLTRVVRSRLVSLTRRRKGRVSVAAHVGTQLGKAVGIVAREHVWSHDLAGDGVRPVDRDRAAVGMIADYAAVVLFQAGDCEAGRSYAELCRRLQRTYRIITVPN